MARAQRLLLPALALYGDAGATCKQLARDIGRPRRTTSRWLRSLVMAGLLEGPVDGIFQFRPKAPDLIRDPRGIPGIHGLVIESRNWPADRLRVVIGHRFGADKVAPGATQRRWSGAFNGRLVRFCYYPGTGQVRVEIPSSSFPIHPEDLPELLGWLSGTFSPFDGGALWVVEIGVHSDYPDVQLKGIAAVQLRPCVGAILQLYNKRADLLRREAHLYPRELSLERAVEVLWGESPTARLERAMRDALEVARLQAGARRPSRPPSPPSDPLRTPPGWGS